MLMFYETGREKLCATEFCLVVRFQSFCIGWDNYPSISFKNLNSPKKKKKKINSYNLIEASHYDQHYKILVWASSKHFVNKIDNGSIN